MEIHRPQDIYFGFGNKTKVYLSSQESSLELSFYHEGWPSAEGPSGPILTLRFNDRKWAEELRGHLDTLLGLEVGRTFWPHEELEEETADA